MTNVLQSEVPARDDQNQLALNYIFDKKHKFIEKIIKLKAKSSNSIVFIFKSYLSVSLAEDGVVSRLFATQGVAKMRAPTVKGNKNVII